MPLKRVLIVAFGFVALQTARALIVDAFGLDRVARDPATSPIRGR